MQDDNNDNGKGVVIEVVAGGFIVTIMSGNNTLFGPSTEAKQIFTKFRDAFDFIHDALAPGENDRDKLDEMERGLSTGGSGPLDAESSDDNPCDDLGGGEHPGADYGEGKKSWSEDDEDPRDHPQFGGDEGHPGGDIGGGGF